jgi:hypothetical protein
VNAYHQYIQQLKEENRYLRQEMYNLPVYSPEWNSNQREIRANMEEIRIMEQLIASDITEMEKVI